MRILLVEDEFIVAFMVREALVDAGHVVLGPVATPAEALQLARRTALDLALVNLHLAEGGDGAEVARALLELTGAPSLFVSGSTIEAREARKTALGLLSKPYDADDVVRSVAVARTILDGRVPHSAQIPHGLELFWLTPPPWPNGASEGHQRA